jgi:hypothetical protein
MAIEFSDDPDTPLNKLIVSLRAQSFRSDCGIDKDFIVLCRVIYQLGFDDGQLVAGKIRRGEFDSVELTKAGEEVGMTLADFSGKTFEVPDGITYSTYNDDTVCTTISVFK